MMNITSGIIIRGAVQCISLTKDTLEEALEVMRDSLFMDESISKAVGLPNYPEAIRELDGIITNAAEDGVSIVAVETSTGKVVGLLLNKLNIKADMDKVFYENLVCKHPAAKYFIDINIVFENIVNPFERLKTDCYFESMFMGILAEYRRKGIAGKLQQASLDILQCMVDGEDVRVPLDGKPLPPYPTPNAIIGYPSSPAVKSILDKMDYIFDCEVDLKDYYAKGSLPDEIISKLPRVMIMYKYFQKSK